VDRKPEKDQNHQITLNLSDVPMSRLMAKPIAGLKAKIDQKHRKNALDAAAGKSKIHLLQHLRKKYHR
jgi:hypothetical protein